MDFASISAGVDLLLDCLEFVSGAYYRTCGALIFLAMRDSLRSVKMEI